MSYYVSVVSYSKKDIIQDTLVSFEYDDYEKAKEKFDEIDKDYLATDFENDCYFIVDIGNDDEICEIKEIRD